MRVIQGPDGSVIVTTEIDGEDVTVSLSAAEVQALTRYLAGAEPLPGYHVERGDDGLTITALAPDDPFDET